MAQIHEIEPQEERWRDLRRASLLEAASRVFARLGYDSASVEDIAFEAGIGKPTIYRYFESKEALFAAALARPLDDLEARLDAVLLIPGSLRERLTRLVGEMVPTFRDHVIPMGDLDRSLTWKQRVFRPHRGRIERRIAGLIAEGQARGEARGLDPAVAARFLVGLVWSGVGSALTDEDGITAAVIEFAFSGLAPEAAA